MSRYEQETIINFNEGDKTAGIYTHNKALRRRLEKLAHERPDECQLEKVSRYGEAVDYIIPKSWVHIYPQRQISEEQRTAMAERLKAANLRQKSPTVQGDSDGLAAGMGKDITQPSDS